MVDNFSILVSHAMIAFVVWRLLKATDPEAAGRELKRKEALERKKGLGRA
jgi:hypothetical protein